jgi:hypothetical protein
MYVPRAISIIASSFTLAMVITVISLVSHFKWHQYRQTCQYHPPSWEYVLSIFITVVTSTAIMGFSISLLVFSVSYNEKWIEVLLLLSGRVLLMKKVRNHSHSQIVRWWDLGSISLEISSGSAHSIHISARIMGKKSKRNSRPSSLDRLLCIGLLPWIYYLYYWRIVSVPKALLYAET